MENETQLSLPRQFRYEQLSRNIDTISNIDELKNLSKQFLKLYLSQQEVLLKINGTTFK